MSGAEPVLEASKSALALISEGITKSLAELKEIGMVGEASTGRGFSDLALTGMELGHDGLTAEFKTFCERWEWGVRAIVNQGNVFALKVGLAAGIYHEHEQYISGTFKIAANTINGNPHLSEDEVAGKSWDEIRGQSRWDGADFSVEAMVKADAEVQQSRQDTKYDVQDAGLDLKESLGQITADEHAAADKELREELNPSQAAVDQAK
ncbi:hypothetical protein ABCR94_05250 [Streptomyces sp. 21So2-11]|uniref:hypothetical protein n=1 Tax=Streptomyces sp. 21So2-11 TaxID=3144408 RepID=UPI00321BEB27